MMRTHTKADDYNDDDECGEKGKGEQKKPALFKADTNPAGQCECGDDHTESKCTTTTGPARETPNKNGREREKSEEDARARPVE